MGKEKRWYGTVVPTASQGPRNSPEENMRQSTATQADTKPAGTDPADTGATRRLDTRTRTRVLCLPSSRDRNRKWVPS